MKSPCEPRAARYPSMVSLQKRNANGFLTKGGGCGAEEEPGSAGKVSTLPVLPGHVGLASSRSGSAAGPASARPSPGAAGGCSRCRRWSPAPASWHCRPSSSRLAGQERLARRPLPADGGSLDGGGERPPHTHPTGTAPRSRAARTSATVTAGPGPPGRTRPGQEGGGAGSLSGPSRTGPSRSAAREPGLWHRAVSIPHPGTGPVAPGRVLPGPLSPPRTDDSFPHPPPAPRDGFSRPLRCPRFAVAEG